jgi:hypothetical protein
VKRTAENKLKVVAARVDPQIEQRLRLLAELTGRKQSFFLQQMIERGIGAMEDTWAWFRKRCFGVTQASGIIPLFKAELFSNAILLEVVDLH